MHSLPVTPPTTFSDPPGTYRCGTLTYTKAGVVSLFLWLLWGDFVFTLMETVVPSIVPLQLEKLGANNTTIGLIGVTIAGVMNMTMNPVISFKSDRHRGKWGRRIPFLLFPTPFIAVFLILLGNSENIGGWLHRIAQWGVSQETLTIWLIAALMICFRFFDLFVGSVYWYLFNDVVPPQFLGRFMALFRAVGQGAAGVYLFAAAPFASTHAREIFEISGLAYLVVFVSMCLKVKEGAYPPPPANVDGRSGFVSEAKTYVLECFCHRVYWLFYATNICWATSLVINAFQIFFFRSVGVDTEAFFKVSAIGQWLTIPFLLAGGYFVDRKHPLRVQMVALFGLTLVTPLQTVFLFHTFSPATAHHIVIASYFLSIPLVGLYAAAEIPMFMMLLPRTRYGQFSSSNALVKSVLAIILGGLLAGAYIDTLAKFTGSKARAYLYVPVWTLAFQILAGVFLILLYRTWKQLGGDNNYVPPIHAEELDQIDRRESNISVDST